MTENVSTPTKAYDLLTEVERMSVDDYVAFAIGEQRRKNERIVHALNLPIPSEYIKRSRHNLLKAIVRAAICEKLQEAADEQDLSPSKVIKEHASIAFSNISDYLEHAGLGELKLKDITDIPKDKMSAVKTIETKPGLHGLTTKVVMHDKLASLKALGEMMGLIAPDKPAPLTEYVTPVVDEDDVVENTPEDVYAKLLEDMQNK